MVITGGTGSLGHALSRSLLAEPIHALRILSRDELKQSEMEKRFSDPRIRFLLGDVRDRDRLRRAFEGANVVIHAAALKRVDKGEYDPSEFVKTNIGGAVNVAEAALDAGVGRVVFVSTDKASAPLTLYGATKLTAERLLCAYNASGGGRTAFVGVRYGNVAGSRGSLIPALIEQRKTGVVTLTDPRMTRFWMTLGDAVRIVRRAATDGGPGEVLIPVLPSVRIPDLIEAVAPGVRVQTIGIRGSEKIHESLISADEMPRAVRWKDIWCLGAPNPSPFEQVPYDSGTNKVFLGVEDIRRLLPQALAEAAQ